MMLPAAGTGAEREPRDATHGYAIERTGARLLRRARVPIPVTSRPVEPRSDADRRPAARLLVEAGGRSFKVAVHGEAFSIGSHDACSLVLDEADVAPRHAVLQRDGDGYELFDLYSPTGTYVNGARVAAAPLRPGDALRVGPVRLVYLLDAPTAPPKPEPTPVAATPEVPSAATPALAFFAETAAPAAAEPPPSAPPSTPPSARPDHGPLVPPKPPRFVRFGETARGADPATFGEALVVQLRRTPFMLVSAALHAAFLVAAYLLVPRPVPTPPPRPVVSVVDPRGVERPEDVLDPAPPEPSAPESPADAELEPAVDELSPPSLAPHDEPDLAPDPGTTSETGIFSAAAGRDGAVGEALRVGPADGGGGSSLRGYARALRGVGLDVVFVLDATGSMETMLADARGRVNEAILVLSTLVPEFRLGVVAFRDRTTGGGEDEFETRALKLTRDHYAAVDFLDGLSAGGGGDRPEAVDAGLREAVEKMPFGRDSRRIVVLVGDAPTRPDALEAARAQVSALRRKNGVLHTVYCSPVGRVEADAQEFFRDLAKRGGGAALDLSRGAGLVDGVLPVVFGESYREEMTRSIADAAGGPVAERWRTFVATADDARVRAFLSRKHASTPYLLAALVRALRPEHLPAFLDVVADGDAPSPHRWAAAVCAKRIIRRAAPPPRLAQLADELDPSRPRAALLDTVQFVRSAGERIGLPTGAAASVKPPRATR
jgi:Mg-chelatase subunit ChlD